ncbi:chemotaxis protein CheA [Pseudobacteriovorax antillogorgiicola]|uniref:histidine kinase n=1 Tax=Pseudobacteriovorax antillogorgiicola TaxID=1513793 RepID=A0A1Y6C5A2_9BACT|nr:ATP-binding protein [Pseudobacteriovorax antillogorgiicola]TCS49793.1 Hpt domain-containing protein [Pseudobacteriovorax antillogorgiicola]SMF42967.1 Hpt domain-containing protein [Pseudobacteriovorax antillogorgiicola]
MIQSEWQQAKSEFGEMFTVTVETLKEELQDIFEEIRNELGQSEHWSTETTAFTLRKLHTIKGTSGQAGFRSLSDHVHHIEDYFSACAKQNSMPSEESFDLLSDWCDCGNQFVSQLSPDSWDDGVMGPSFQRMVELVEGILRSQGEQRNDTPPSDEPKAADSGATDKKIEISPSDYDVLYSSIKETLDFLISIEVPGVESLLSTNEKALLALVSARRSSARPLAHRLKRLVRSVAKSLDKPVNFQVEGFDAEIDRNLLKSLSEILTHMLRNSLDHGIEEREARCKLGKSEKSDLSLVLDSRDDRAIVELRDDGRGLNPDVIAQKAIEKGVISAEQALQMTQYEKQFLIFHAGFSTKEEVSDLSGRGVGMDAVMNEIKRFGGQVVIDSEVGQGTSFHLEFPAAYQSIPVVVFSVGGQNLFIQADYVDAIATNASQCEVHMGMVMHKSSGVEYLQMFLPGLTRGAGGQWLLVTIDGMQGAIECDRILDMRQALINSTPIDERFPCYLNGFIQDRNYGCAFGLDLTEIERNFNQYLEDGEDIAGEHSQDNQREIPMRPRQPLSGNMISREQIYGVLDGEQLLDKLRGILQGDELHQAGLTQKIAEYIATEIDSFKESISSIDDMEDLQYMVAIRYASLKSNWILLNTQMAYQVEHSVEVPIETQYKASILSTLLESLEPLSHPQAIQYISEVLSQPLREAG